MTLKPAHLLVLVLATAAMPVMAQNIAVVNGKPIPASRIDLLMKQLVTQGQKDTPELRARIKEKLIESAYLSQEAEKEGLASTPEVKNNIELNRQSALVNALVQNFKATHKVKDEAVNAEYEKYKAQISSQKEYQVRHILLESEDDAKAVIAKLKGGAKFEDLAKEKSKEPGASENGGEMGWSNGSNYEKSFLDALSTLKKGQFTETPVHTRWGYHVILLEDTRPMKVPTLAELKPQIIQRLQNEELGDFLKSLKDKAKIDDVSATPKKKDADAASAPAAKK